MALLVPVEKHPRVGIDHLGEVRDEDRLDDAEGREDEHHRLERAPDAHQIAVFNNAYQIIDEISRRSIDSYFMAFGFAERHARTNKLAKKSEIARIGFGKHIAKPRAAWRIVLRSPGTWISSGARSSSIAWRA